jgi:hypothetical protein
MLIISAGTSRVVLRLLKGQLRTLNQSRIWGIRESSTIGSAHDRIPADLAKLWPTLEEMGSGLGDNEIQGDGLTR